MNKVTFERNEDGTFTKQVTTPNETLGAAIGMLLATAAVGLWLWAVGDDDEDI